MPQMAPLSWLTMMIVFSTILIMFNIKNYYSKTYPINQNKISSKKHIKNWKW